MYVYYVQVNTIYLLSYVSHSLHCCVDIWATQSSFCVVLSLVYHHTDYQ